MKTVINKTQSPIKIALPRGKVLRLGPGKSGQIRDEDAEAGSLKALAAAGDLEIHEGAGHGAGGATATGGRPSAGGGAHGRATFRQRKGDR